MVDRGCGHERGNDSDDCQDERSNGHRSLPGTLSQVSREHCETVGMDGTQLDSIPVCSRAFLQVSGQFPRLTGWRPQQDSNLRTRLRRPLLYPLSYGGFASFACYGGARRAGARLPVLTCTGHGADLPAWPSLSR